MPLPTTLELLAREIAAALSGGVVKQGVAKSLSLLFPAAKVFCVVLVGDRNCVVQHANFLQEGSISRAPIPIKLSVVGHSVVKSVGVEASALTEEALQSAADIMLMSRWGCLFTVAVPIPGDYDAERGSNCSLGALTLGFPQECVTDNDKVRLASIAKLLSHRVQPLIAAMIPGLQRDGIIGAAFCCACKGQHSYQRIIPPSLPSSSGGRVRNRLPTPKAAAVGGGGGSLSNSTGQLGQSGGLNSSNGDIVEHLTSVLNGVDSALRQLIRQKPVQQQKQGSAGSGGDDLPARSQDGSTGASSRRRYDSAGAGSQQQQPWRIVHSSGDLHTMSGVASPGGGSPGTIAPSSAPWPTVSSTGSLTSLVAAGGVTSQQQPLLPATASMLMASQAVPRAANGQLHGGTFTVVGPAPNMMNGYSPMQQQQLNQLMQQQGDDADEELAPAMPRVNLAAWRSRSATDIGLTGNKRPAATFSTAPSLPSHMESLLEGDDHVDDCLLAPAAKSAAYRTRSAPAAHAYGMRSQYVQQYNTHPQQQQAMPVAAPFVPGGSGGTTTAAARMLTSQQQWAWQQRQQQLQQQPNCISGPGEFLQQPDGRGYQAEVPMSSMLGSQQAQQWGGVDAGGQHQDAALQQQQQWGGKGQQQQQQQQQSPQQAVMDLDWHAPALLPMAPPQQQQQLIRPQSSASPFASPFAMPPGMDPLPLAPERNAAVGGSVQGRSRSMLQSTSLQHNTLSMAPTHSDPILHHRQQQQQATYAAGVGNFRRRSAPPSHLQPMLSATRPLSSHTMAATQQPSALPPVQELQQQSYAAGDGAASDLSQYLTHDLGSTPGQLQQQQRQAAADRPRSLAPPRAELSPTPELPMELRVGFDDGEGRSWPPFMLMDEELPSSLPLNMDMDLPDIGPEELDALLEGNFI